MGCRAFTISSAALAMLVGIGCGSAGDTATDSTSDDVHEVPHTSIKDQGQVGDCWMFMSVAWAESLRLQGPGDTVDLSEGYLMYWHWFEVVHTRLQQVTGINLLNGGFFSRGVDLMNRFGLVHETDFPPVNKTVEDKIEAALSKELKEDSSPRNIRKILNEAFGISNIPGLEEDMEALFPLDTVPESIVTRAPNTIPSRFTQTSKFDVGFKDPKGSRDILPISEVIPKWKEKPLALDVLGVGNRHRGLIRKVQKAIHDAQPVPIYWLAHAGSQVGSTYPEMKAKNPSEANLINAGHVTILQDYAAENVPNYGVLPAGVTIDDQNILDAALSDQAEVTFFRIKNSWGMTAPPAITSDPRFKGHFDLYLDYLVLPERTLSTLLVPDGLVGFVLPDGYDDHVPSGINPDACLSPLVTGDGDYCAASLNGDPDLSDLLLTCRDGVTISATTCEKGCSREEKKCVEPVSVANPCENASSSGAYCGSSLGIPATDQNASRLFACQKNSEGKWISPLTLCLKGCQAVNGADDQCL